MLDKYSEQRRIQREQAQDAAASTNTAPVIPPKTFAEDLVKESTTNVEDTSKTVVSNVATTGGSELAPIEEEKKELEETKDIGAEAVKPKQKKKKEKKKVEKKDSSGGFLSSLSRMFSFSKKEKKPPSPESSDGSVISSDD